MGRRAAPTIDKKLTGNPGKRAINTREPVARVGLPDPPDHLDADARHHWDQFGAELVKEKRLGVVYGPLFAAYCVAWSRWQQAERRVRTDGPVTITQSGYEQKSAWLTIADRAWSQVIKALSEMGLTPTSQTRAVRIEESPEELDPFAAFDHPDANASKRVN
jgi:P27 family predicted phage terminase small subunit